MKTIAAELSYLDRSELAFGQVLKTQYLLTMPYIFPDEELTERPHRAPSVNIAEFSLIERILWRNAVPDIHE